MIDKARFTTNLCLYNLIYELPSEIYQDYLWRIRDFTSTMSEDGQSKDYYEKKRNGKRVKDNILIGKYGEFAAAYILHQHGFPLLTIDCAIRSGKNKKWLPDLPYSLVRSELPDCHVKTCDDHSHDYVGDYSWTFQFANKYGKGGQDHLFAGHNDNDIVLLMYVPSLESHSVSLLATAPWYLLKNKLRNPIAKHLEGLKLCVYYQDLLNGKKV